MANKRVVGDSEKLNIELEYWKIVNRDCDDSITCTYKSQNDLVLSSAFINLNIRNLRVNLGVVLIVNRSKNVGTRVLTALLESLPESETEANWVSFTC